MFTLFRGSEYYIVYDHITLLRYVCAHIVPLTGFWIDHHYFPEGLIFVHNGTLTLLSHIMFKIYGEVEYNIARALQILLSPPPSSPSSDG